ncbi:MAG: hypothetical protein Q9160_004926 [Pyrenula sp. 1 TL-2023]
MSEAPISCESGCFACFDRCTKPQQAGGDINFLHAAAYRPPPPVEASQLLPAAPHTSSLSSINANRLLPAIAYGPPQPPVRATQLFLANAYTPPSPAEVKRLLSAATHQGLKPAVGEESKTLKDVGDLNSPSNQNSVDSVHTPSGIGRGYQFPKNILQISSSSEIATFPSANESSNHENLSPAKDRSPEARSDSNVFDSAAYADLDDETREFVVRGMTERQISWLYPANGIDSRIPLPVYESTKRSFTEPIPSHRRSQYFIDETYSNSARSSAQSDLIPSSPPQLEQSRASPLNANHDETDDAKTLVENETEGALGVGSASPEKPLPSLPDDDSSDSDGPPTPQIPIRIPARFSDRMAERFHDRFPDQFPDMREYSSQNTSPLRQESVLGGRWLLLAEEQDRKAAELKKVYAKAAAAYDNYLEKETALNNFKNVVDVFNQNAAAPAAAINASNMKAASDLVAAKDEATAAIGEFKEKADVYNDLYAKRLTAINTTTSTNYRNDQTGPALKIKTSDLEDGYMNAEPRPSVKTKHSPEKPSISPIKNLINRSRSLKKDAFGKKQNASKSAAIESAGGFESNVDEVETPKRPKSPIKRFARLLVPKPAQEPPRLDEPDQFIPSIVTYKPARLLGLNHVEEPTRPTRCVAQSPDISVVEEEPEPESEKDDDLPTPKPTDASFTATTPSPDIPNYQTVLAETREETPATPSIKSLMTCSSFESSFLRQFDENGYDGQFDLPLLTMTTTHRRDLLNPKCTLREMIAL